MTADESDGARWRPHSNRGRQPPVTAHFRFGVPPATRTRSHTRVRVVVFTG